MGKCSRKNLNRKCNTIAIFAILSYGSVVKGLRVEILGVLCPKYYPPLDISGAIVDKTGMWLIGAFSDKPLLTLFSSSFFLAIFGI